jgi:hypothetical protein
MTTAALSAMSSVVAVLVAVCALFAALYKRGQSEGRQTEIMSQLAALGADHEARLRALEHITRTP